MCDVERLFVRVCIVVIFMALSWAFVVLEQALQRGFWCIHSFICMCSFVAAVRVLLE